MKDKKNDNLIWVRLFPGQDIFEKLKKVCQKYKIKTALVISGIGQLKNFQLGYFKKKGDYCPQEFSKAQELLSLCGNIIKQDKDFIFHLHAVLANQKKEVVGGHLLKGKVSVTNEIVLLKVNVRMRRKTNPITGLKDLFLE